MRFNEKKILITGASRGIGAAISKAFKSEGAFVLGTKTKREEKSPDYCDDWFYGDFSVSSDLEQCIEFIDKHKPDILINNAGINENKPFTEIDPITFQKIQFVNLYAPFILSQAVIRHMLKKSWGRIINISSIWGVISMENRAAYSASKFGLDGLTLALSAEHCSNGILANCIAPGFFDTDLTRKMLTDDEMNSLISKVPMKRLGDVNELCSLALWLASEDNTFVTGQNIPIDGGFTRA